MNQLKSIMKEILDRLFTILNLFWIVYILLLVVMLPHTQWVANQVFNSNITSWAFAIVVEFSMLPFTYILKDSIGRANELTKSEQESETYYQYRKFKIAYVNVEAVGAAIISIITGLSNFAYATQHFQGQNLDKVTEGYWIHPIIFHIAFGGILPVISFLFANILAKQAKNSKKKIVSDVEMLNLQSEIKDKDSLINGLEVQIKGLQKQLKENIVSDGGMLPKGMDSKKDQIIWLKKNKKISNSSIAKLVDCQPSYVTGVLKNVK